MTEENTTPEMEQSTTEATTDAPAADAMPSEGILSVADLKMMARIIQVGSTRGTFKAEELGTVGGLYNKIISFLGAAGQLDPEPTTEQPAAQMMPEEIDGSKPSDEAEETKE